MRNDVASFLQYAAIIVLMAGCAPQAKLYQNDDVGRTYGGLLSDSVFNSVKRLLTEMTGKDVQDTIIIKYDYDKETCWNNLDQRNDEQIKAVLNHRNNWVRQVLKSRPNISFFHFREPGEQLNKVIRWDSTVYIDSSKQLFHWLFNQRSICGNSIIIMPDKRFVFLRSDPHFEVFGLY